MTNCTQQRALWQVQQLYSALKRVFSECRWLWIEKG